VADKVDGIIISEILVDNPAGGFDTDGDGSANKSDEFVEIQNTTGSAISLDGFQVWTAKNGLLYSFGSGDTISAGGTATIVGEYTGTLPAGHYDAGVAEGADFLRDGEGAQTDSIFLVNSATGEYVVLSYGAPPSTPVLPSGFPGTTQVGAGETINSSGPNGTAFLRDANGDFVEGAPTPGTSGVPCYAPGTLIQTADGPRAVEALRLGDLVWTLDRGLQPVCWIDSFEQLLSDLSDDERPVLIAAGTLGKGLPERDLIVSPQHRILVGPDGHLWDIFDSPALVPSKSLTCLPGIRHMKGKRSMNWFHFALDRHEVVRANGCAAESLLFGPQVIRLLGARQHREVMRLFPNAAGCRALNGLPAHRCLPTGHARRVLSRATRNEQRRA
jgi:hypothetical protein